MLFTILIITYFLLAIVLVIGLLVNGMRPSKTLAWLLAIFTIPVGGILLYLMLGRNRRKNKLIKLKKSAFISQHPSKIPSMVQTMPKYQKIVSLIYKNCSFPPTVNNRLRLLKDGKTTFESIFKALEGARSYIHIQYYIYEEGALATRLLELFRKKISEGVVVRMIFDGIGSFSLSKSYISQLKEAGVDVFPFLPFRFGRFLSSVNYRNHRKIIVVDGEVAFTGGINISDKYLKGDPVLGKWHDMHLQINGPAVVNLDNVFSMDWNLVSEKRIAPIPAKDNDATEQGALVQIVHSGPDDDFGTIELVYFSMINEAEKYVYITNPYIIPSQAILGALQTAALSGIDVRLLISEQADSKMVQWSVRSYFESLLRAGVKIYLFPDGFVHSKIIISDDNICTIGTANIDVRSFEQNYEVNAVIYDTTLTKTLKADFMADCSKSKELIRETYLNRPWLHKLREGVAKIFSPIL
ncbi:cardiolipin synthase [Spongiimicrobium sp. 3-5]|uniref:cardiolipin synthase n=1 Tax=Spongiimicrobium sp. 3-5 TaxID=3332596 RepID=UPI0039808409